MKNHYTKKKQFFQIVKVGVFKVQLFYRQKHENYY